jgi:hypothetical protein
VSARRYIAVVQAAEGYPARGAALEQAPPDGPAPPVIHSVVLEDDFAALESQVDGLVEALREVGNAYGCYAGCTGALPGAPADGSGHTPGCRKARAALRKCSPASAKGGAA